MNPEQWFIVHREQSLIELLVILVLQSRRCLCPQRFYIIYNVVLFCVLHLAVFPFLLFAEYNRYWHELAVFVQQFLDSLLLKELFTVIADMQHDISTALLALCITYFIFRTTVASPFHSLAIIFVTLGDNVNTVAHHKARVETQTKVADNSICLILIFIKEVGNARESNLIDISVNFFLGHTNTVVWNSQGLCLGVQLHADSQFT